MVYRVHDEAERRQAADRFRQFILRFGHVFKATGGPSRRQGAEQALRRRSRVRPEENAVTTLAVRSMAKAFYTTDNIGHYGLAFPYYTHFTSPIRRYPDMMVHRLLARYLAGEQGGRQDDARRSVRPRFGTRGDRLRGRTRLDQVQDGRIHEGSASARSSTGTFRGITEWSIYRRAGREPTSRACRSCATSKVISSSSTKPNYEIVGRSTGRRMTLGDAVRIRVKRADLQKRQLDFELLIDNGRPMAPASREDGPKVRRSTRRKNR